MPGRAGGPLTYRFRAAHEMQLPSKATAKSQTYQMIAASARPLVNEAGLAVADNPKMLGLPQKKISIDSPVWRVTPHKVHERIAKSV